MARTKRNAAIDMLKVISIYFIILHHYALWSGWQFTSGFSLAKTAAQTLLMGGKLGVDIFVMITGYFVIKSTAKVKSLVTIWIETTLISLTVYFVMVGFHLGGVTFSLHDFVLDALPILFARYWFVTAYTLLYFSIPILNYVFLRISNAARLRMLTVMFVLFSLVPFIFYEKGMTFSFPIWFMFLYLVGAYLRLNADDLKKISKTKLWLLLGLLSAVSIATNVFLQWALSTGGRLKQIITFLGWNETVFYTRDASPLMLLMAVVIMLLVMQMTLSPKPFVQYLTRAAFGVYLLQSSPVFSTNFLWPTVVNAKRFTSGGMIIGYGLLVAAVIYIVGSVLYSVLFPIRQLVLKMINRPIIKVQQWFSKVKIDD